jgi:hypothetical protein
LGRVDQNQGCSLVRVIGIKCLLGDPDCQPILRGRDCLMTPAGLCGGRGEASTIAALVKLSDRRIDLPARRCSPALAVHSRKRWRRPANASLPLGRA